MSVAYVDTSALVKLVVREPESDALRSWLSGPAAPATLATSALTRVELVRAARRHSLAAVAVAESVLSTIDHIAITAEVLADAASLLPTTMRSLDAIHLATARAIGASLSLFVAYDHRLINAAAGAGLPIHEPR